MTDKSPIIFYQYFATTDLEYFQNLIRKKFKETGHDRDIEFRVWVCDDDVPPKDGDIYCYDAFVLRFLAENGYIRQLPDIISTDGIFPWVLDTTKFKGKTYGFPWLLCFDALICRAEDYKDSYSDEDLNGNLALALGTFYVLYFAMISALCMEPMTISEGEDVKERKAYKIIEHLAKLSGDPKKAASLHYQDPELLNEFLSGKKKYIAHFPEVLSKFPEGDYAISHIKYQTDDKDEPPLFYVDFASIGVNVKEEKLLDCLDLLEIISSQDFVYDICAPNGKPSFMCPAHEDLYKKLAGLNGFYDKLYDVVKNPENCAIRYNADYYDMLSIIINSLGPELDAK